MIFFRKRFLMIFLAVTVFVNISCSKTADTNPVTDPPIGTTAGGKLYVGFYDSLMKIDLNTDVVSWKAKDINSFGAAQSYINYDSALLYHGNYYGMTCYNSIDGSIVWIYNWGSIGFSGNTNSDGYNVVFNDSLAFFSSTTTGVWFSTLYCVNKRTGALRWQQRIDLQIGIGTADLHAASPVLSNDKVVILGKSINGGKKIFCFNAISGDQIWETPGENNLLMGNLKVKDGKVFSTGQSAFCFDLLTGNQLWQKDITIGAPGNIPTNSSFIQDGHLVIIRKNDTNPCDVRVLDQNTGNTISGFTLPDVYENCFTKNNKVYFTYVDTGVILRAINLNSGTEIWHYRSRNFDPSIAWDNLEHSAPVVTNSNIMFTENYYNNFTYKTNVTILDLNGNFVKEAAVNKRLLVMHFVYIDNNNNIFKDNDR